MRRARSLARPLDACPSAAQDFTFDYSYWSHDGFTKRESDGVLIADGAASKYADQAQVMSDLGSAVLENAWGGFNSCVFAHGQVRQRRQGVWRRG
jgi:hypothetical protein